MSRDQSVNELKHRPSRLVVRLMVWRWILLHKKCQCLQLRFLLEAVEWAINSILNVRVMVWWCILFSRKNGHVFNFYFFLKTWRGQLLGTWYHTFFHSQHIFWRLWVLQLNLIGKFSKLFSLHCHILLNFKVSISSFTFPCSLFIVTQLFITGVGCSSK